MEEMEIDDMPYLKLPEILWIQIFKYLFIEDFNAIRLSCRRLKLYTDHYPDIYERECLRLFSSELNLFRYSYYNFL